MEKIADKYAPTDLNEVIYPNQSTELVVKSIANGTLNVHPLFYGPNGTAKSTTANLLANAVGGTYARIQTDFQKLMALPNLKGDLQNWCHSDELIFHSKTILLFDEFDTYKGVPNQLWDAMDSLQSKGLMVIITTNELSKIHRSVRDRCELIEFPALTADAVLPRAQQILNAEGLSLPDQQVKSYLKTVERQGSIRQYCSQLEKLLLINENGLTFPSWNVQKPSLTVVKP